MKKPIKGYEQQYSIDTQGNVYSTPLDGKPNKVLKFEIIKRSNSNYHRVSLSKDGKVSRFFVHRLVAETFIPNSSNLPIINHIDNDGTNNHVDNLEWCTQKENIAHSVNQGRHSSNDIERLSIAGNKGRQTRAKKAKLKYDNLVGSTFGNRKLLAINNYGKHPKGQFLCLTCGNEFQSGIHESLHPKNPNAHLGCRSCSQKHSRRKDIV